jgi:hypothetical protein
LLKCIIDTSVEFVGIFSWQLRLASITSELKERKILNF